MTVTDSPAVAGAVEAAAEKRIESHLNPPPSYDLADHPVPTGREEIWRFTPLKRLGGILDGEPSDRHLDWDTTLPDGVTLTKISAAKAIELGELAPGDRPAALAVAQAGERCSSTCPPTTPATSPSGCACTVPRSTTWSGATW